MNNDISYFSFLFQLKQKIKFTKLKPTIDITIVPIYEQRQFHFLHQSIEILISVHIPYTLLRITYYKFSWFLREVHVFAYACFHMAAKGLSYYFQHQKDCLMACHRCYVLIKRGSSRSNTTNTAWQVTKVLEYITCVG